jgi:hypothetical protein
MVSLSSVPSRSTTRRVLPCSMMLAGVSVVMMLPFRSIAIRSQRTASSIRWVLMNSAVPPSASSLKVFQNLLLSCGSTAAVGSSRKITSGSWTRVHASETLRFIPPEKVCTALLARSERSVNWRTSSTLLFRFSVRWAAPKNATLPLAERSS